MRKVEALIYHDLQRNLFVLYCEGSVFLITLLSHFQAKLIFDGLHPRTSILRGKLRFHKNGKGLNPGEIIFTLFYSSRL
jgi:hypothetical protein